MTRGGVIATATWAALAAVAAVIVVSARYTTDLSAFLPRSPTPAQRLLVDQLREGLASRLILIGIEGSEASRRTAISLAMGRTLRADPQFVSVGNGEPAGLEREREILFSHRYLLSEAVDREHFSAAGLRAAIQETLDLLASPAGLLAKSLLTRDPTGEMMQIVDQLGSARQPPALDGAWVSRDGKRAVMVVQTRAAGSDTDGQERAVAAVRGAFAAAAAAIPGATLEMSGPGVFSVAARAAIKQQVTRLSVASTLLISLLLLSVYRSVGALILGLIPVASGALAGIAAVALGFSVVHGITLGFGVTLIGESVDYSIYLFIQAANRSATLWRTIRLGVLTSIVGFASLLPSSFPGLAQLGLFSISGLIAAALVTRYVLPNLLPERFVVGEVTPIGRAVAAALGRRRLSRSVFLLVPALSVAVLCAHRGAIWNPELSALSPISAADQALDARLRSDIGAPDVSCLVVVSGRSEESVLEASETVDTALDALVDKGVILGYESPSRYLPSREAQLARQSSIPPRQELSINLASALEGMPLRPERLQPFVAEVEAARNQPLLTRKDLEATSLASGVDALLLNEGSRWSALLPLRLRPVAFDVGAVHSALSGLSLGAGVEAVVLDVKSEVDSLYSSYLSEAVGLSLAGFLGIVLLLLVFLRSPSRVTRVVAPLVLAVLAVSAGLVMAGQKLTILHLIGMLLIVAVGSNYALFFDRRAAKADDSDFPRTLASLVIANAATVLGFGVLAFSSVPILSALGSTVAPGAFLALVFAALLAEPTDCPDNKFTTDGTAA
jgi:predicted exporter